MSAIFNEKFTGAMEKQSRTWVGMTGNINDQWLRFINMVMRAMVPPGANSLSEYLETRGVRSL